MSAQQYAIPQESWWKRFRRLPRNTRLTLGFTMLNVVGIAIYFVMLYVLSEKWWFSSLLVYAPRSPFVVPSIVLLLASLAYHRKSAWANLLGLVVVGGLMMGLQIPVENMMGKPPRGTELKLVSCNVQGFEPDFATVLQEVSNLGPSVVAFQEVEDPDHPLLNRYFADWNKVAVDEYFVASQYPVRLLGSCQTEAYDRLSAIAVEIATPEGPVVLCNLHLMTPRPWLEELNAKGVVTGESQGFAENHYLMRELESATVRAFVADFQGKRPLLIAGDFNAPSDSNLFHTFWGSYQNAFQSAGFGYGYTAPAAKHRLWFSGVPWVRIDHILTDGQWHVSECVTGKKNGSDHRLIAATLVKK